MGKDLKGNELGKCLRQRQNGLYEARIRHNGMKDVSIYGRDLEELQYKLQIFKETIPNSILYTIPKVEHINSNADSNKEFVYFITDGKYVKIGKANNVYKRLKQLQTGSASILKVLLCVNVTDSYKAENKLHKLFQDKNVNNEWFDILDNFKSSVVLKNIEEFNPFIDLAG